HGHRREALPQTRARPGTFRRPAFAPPPRPAVLGTGHDAMVTKEFWPRSAPIAITNVAGPRPNPILINTGRDEPTRTRAGWMTAVGANVSPWRKRVPE